MKTYSSRILLAGLIIAIFGMNNYDSANAITSGTSQLSLPSNVEAGVVNEANKRNTLMNRKNILDSLEEAQINTSVIENEKSLNLIQSPKFQLNQVIFNGNTIFQTQDLQKFVESLIGSEITLEKLNEATVKITELYKQNGYITSLAYIPPQKIEDGVIEIAILEGKVGNIDIQGNKWVRTSYVRNNLLKANNFEENKIFNVQDLRKSLGEINSNNYLKGQVILQKGDEPETTDIILELKDKFPLSLGVSWDNMGRDLIGVQRSTVSVSNNNLTGFGDSLAIGTSFASRTFGLSTSYSLPLGPYGTELRTGYSLSNIELGGTYKQYKIDGLSQAFNVGLAQPIYKTDNLEITSDIGLDFIHSKMTMLKSTPLQKYDLRVLESGINLIKDDSYGRWISRAEVGVGLPILGGTDTSSYGVGSSKFVRLNSNLIRVQYLPANTLGIVKLMGQYSPNALLGPEQFQIGGSYSVRGYDEGLVLGDLGYVFSLELRRPVPYLPESVKIPLWHKKIKNIKLKDRIHYAAFYDQGFALPIHQGSCEHYTNFLQSFGVGLRCQLTKMIMANMDLGIPLGKDRIKNQDRVRFHFSISSNFL